jgi:hypothetical protein
MELVAGAMVVTTVCVAAGYVTLRGAGAAAQVVTQMFNSPADLGWPSGVQEDDDFHWRWSARPGPLADVDSRLGDAAWSQPEIVDLQDGSGPRALPVSRH